MAKPSINLAAGLEPIVVQLPGTSAAHAQRISAYAMTLLAAEVSRRGVAFMSPGTLMDIKALAKQAALVFDGEGV